MFPIIVCDVVESNIKDVVEAILKMLLFLRTLIDYIQSEKKKQLHYNSFKFNQNNKVRLAINECINYKPQPINERNNVASKRYEPTVYSVLWIIFNHIF